MIIKLYQIIINKYNRREAKVVHVLLHRIYNWKKYEPNLRLDHLDYL